MDRRLVRLFQSYMFAVPGWVPRGPCSAAFLSAPGNVVFQAGDALYVLDAFTGKIAFLAQGRKPVVMTERFRLDLAQYAVERGAASPGSSDGLAD